MAYFNKYLKDDEDLVDLIRQHFLVFFKPGLVAMILFLSPFFLMFLLFRWETFGLILFLILLFFGIFLLIRVIIVWSFNAFLITSQRVVLFKQRGFFDRQVAEVEYEKIQDISYRVKGLTQTLFHYGSVKIQIANSETTIIARKISKPREVQQLLLKIKNNRLAKVPKN